MTLILSSITRDFVVQTSDRLVTTQSRQPFDRLSNKSIVFQARDAIVTMAYTGLAYLDGVPTDQWLAGNISGCSWKDGEIIPLMFGAIPRWSHIGPTLTRIQKGLEQVFRSKRLTKNARRMPFELAVAGWQWNRRGQARPTIAVVGKEKGKSSVTIARLPRAEGWLGRGIGCPTSHLTSSDIESMKEDMGKANSPNEVKMVGVNGIRRVSNRTSVVGPDCMSVFIHPPGLGRVDITYFPRQDWQMELGAAGSKANTTWTPAIFSPWVIGRGALQGPMAQSGGWTLQLDQFAVYMDGPKVKEKPSGGKNVHYWGFPVKRPADPS